LLSAVTFKSHLTFAIEQWPDSYIAPYIAVKEVWRMPSIKNYFGIHKTIRFSTAVAPQTPNTQGSLKEHLEVALKKESKQ